MPLIEAIHLPTFDPAQVQVVVAHCYPDGLAAAHHVQWFGLSFPVIFDFDGELFRRFRMPNQVYPLNMVIDASGNLVQITNDLDEAVATVNSLTP